MFIVALIMQATLFNEPMHTTLSVARDIWDVTARDLNSDGRLDLVALYGEQNTFDDDKGVYVYIAKPNGTYGTKPSLDFPLAPSTGNTFLTERDGSTQLVVFTESGATQYRYHDGRFEESNQYEFSTLFPLHTRKPVFMRYVAHDLDGDASDEWLLPVLNGFDVWGVGKEPISLRADIFSEAFSYNGIHVSHRIPKVHVFERPGDTNKAVGFVGERGVTFHYGKNWKISRRFMLPRESKDQWDTQATLADINNDGNPDLMVSNTKGTANIEVRIGIYFADENLKYPQKPSFEYTTEGGLSTPTLIDLNDDGRQDLVVRGFPITLRNIANYLFRKKISMKIETHLFGKNTFSTKVSYTNFVTAEVSEGREEIAHAYGDFDGDGKKDIAIGARSDTLTILTHGRNGEISTRPWKTINVPTFGIARIADLDGNGRDDIVIYHPHGKNQKDIEVIRF